MLDEPDARTVAPDRKIQQIELATEFPEKILPWVKFQELIVAMTQEDAEEDCTEFVEFVKENFADYLQSVMFQIAWFYDLRPKKVKIIAKAATDICLHFHYKPHFLHFRTRFPRLTYRLYMNGVYTDEDIKEHSKRTSLIFSLFVARKLGNEITELPYCFNEITVEQISANDYQLLNDIIEYSYDHTSINYALKYDDIEMFQQLASVPGFDMEHTINIDLTEIKKPTTATEKPLIVTPLAFAAFYGSKKCFDYIALNGGSFTESVCEKAVMGGNIDIIRQCLTRCPEGFEREAFMNAIIYNRNDIADFLLTNCKCRGTNLKDCVYAMNIPACEYAVENGLELDKVVYGTNPLVLSTERLSYPMALFLLEKGADINYPLGEGKLEIAPIHIVAGNGLTDIIKLFIERGADLNVVTPDQEGLTPVHCAVLGGCPLDSLPLLLEAKADPKILTKKGKKASELTIKQETIDLLAKYE